MRMHRRQDRFRLTVTKRIVLERDKRLHLYIYPLYSLYIQIYVQTLFSSQARTLIRMNDIDYIWHIDDQLSSPYISSLFLNNNQILQHQIEHETYDCNENSVSKNVMLRNFFVSQSLRC